MNVVKYVELVNNWRPADEMGIGLKSEFQRLSEQIKKMGTKTMLGDYEYEVKEHEAKREEASLRDENALEKFYDMYVPKIYYDTSVAKLNEIYKEIEKKYGLERRKRVEEEIDNFAKRSGEMKTEINKVKAELVLGDENKNFELTDAVRGLDSEFAELVAESDRLIGEIDSFVNETGSADFSMTPAQIKKRVSELGKNIRDLKQNLVHKYDARVALTNAKIAELKNRTDLTPEIMGMINGLSELQLCGVTVKGWKHNSFLKDIDFNKLMEVNKLIANIEGNIKSISGPSPIDGEKEDNDMQHLMIKLDADISQIETEISKLDSEVVPGLSPADLADKMQRLDDIESLINCFISCLQKYKDSMPEEEYKEYVERIEDAVADVALLYTKLQASKGKSSSPDDDKNKDVDYNELLSKAEKLSSDINKLYDDVETFKGKVDEDGVTIFEKRLSDFEQKLEDLKKDIETRNADGKLDPNQYRNLMDKVSEMEKKLKETKDKIKDPGMVMGSEAFEVLSERVGKLKAEVERLDSQVNGFKPPIRDKATRNNIEAAIAGIDEEIKFLEDSLEVYKDKDVNKYNELKNDLDDIKDKFEKTQEEYRKRCPLRVRIKKDAKKLYKKHPKLCLLAAGLAATALVHATVGPVLIPAIMHGNLMIMNKLPILRPFFKFTNNILGRMINATIQTVTMGNTTFAGWVLANGTMINPSCAAASLLKGVAISGIGSTLMVAPIVIAIKELVEKMKTVDLKQKLSETVKKGKVGDTVTKGKDKIGDTFKKKKKKNIDELIKDFSVSGKTLQEFVEENGLNKNEQLEFYKALAIAMQKQSEVQKEDESLEENQVLGRR